MQLTKIKKIIVFGGGTSGWLTAAYLLKNLRIPAEIVLIEDSSAGPIGVGEGTQPFTAQFLYQCGIRPKDWMKPSNASFKLGVELTGWNDRPYFVDNDNATNCIIAENYFTSDYFAGRDPQDFVDWHPAYQLAKANKCLKIEEHLDQNFGMGEEGYGAVHFAALQIVQTIKNIIIDKITYVDTKITEVKHDIHGITKLVSESGEHYSADLYLDCSGFKSKLLGETLKVPFESYEKWLPNDKAVVLQTQFTNPEQDCFPYTKATAMNAGWRFTIPIFTRTGNGYIYSSKFLTPEQAEAELRASVKEYEAKANHLTMRCGRHVEIAHKNVVAIGLSAGFVEPLEATGITFTTGIVKAVTDLLNQQNNILNNNVRNNLNSGFYEMAMEILAFVWAHYHFCNKDDTPYWQNIRQQRIEDLPKDVQYMLSAYYPNPPRYMFFSPSSMFNAIQWFSVLNAGGAYKNHISTLTEKQKIYGKYFTDVQQFRIDSAKKIFPNQYEYLKEWYQ